MERFWRVDMSSQTQIDGLRHIGQGKVRDIYAINDEHLLLVASDRISAFDVVMTEPIPNKGQVLTQLAKFWFEKTSHIIQNHLISADDSDVQRAVEAVGGTWDDWLNGRVMLCQRTSIRTRMRSVAQRAYCPTCTSTSAKAPAVHATAVMGHSLYRLRGPRHRAAHSLMPSPPGQWMETATAHLTQPPHPTLGWIPHLGGKLMWA